MNQVIQTSSSNEETEQSKVDLLVRKHEDGRLVWGLPALGLCDTYSISYLEEFMENRRLTYRVVPAINDNQD